MKQCIKRVFCLLLSLLIVLPGVLIPSAPTAAAITQSDVQSKIASLKEAFPTGSYFTTNGHPCTEKLEYNSTYNFYYCYNRSCPTCDLGEILGDKGNKKAKTLLPSYPGLNLGRHSCCAFAGFAFYYIFGHEARSSNSYAISSANFGGINEAFLSQLRPGDYLVCNGDDHYAIFLGYDSNKIYIYDANSTGPCQVKYRGSRDWSFYNKIEAYRSKTYDAGDSVVPTIVHGYSGSADEITENNAIVYGTVNKSTGTAVEKFGIRIRRSTNTYENGWSYYHTASSNHIGKTAVKFWFNIQEEVGITLSHATNYTYQLYAKIDGEEYWSEEKTITTAGSHSYGAWTVTKEATCTTDGSRQRKCECGHTQTEKIAKLGHKYSDSYTIETNPSCTQPGSKYRQCTRCTAKTGITEISATGHKWGAWSVTKEPSVTECGEETRICSTCSEKETKSIPQLTIEEITSGTCGDQLTWTLDETGTLTISGTGAMTNYDEWNAAPWATLEDRIKYVVVADGVISVGDEAFYGLSNVTTATIGNDVTSIGHWAFSGCEELTTVVIGKSVTSIGYYAFRNCVRLTGVDIPDSVIRIDTDAFQNCSGMTHLTIGNGVECIGPAAFENCAGLTQLTIPNSVESILSAAFAGCSQLTCVTISDSVTYIEDYAFAACDSLTTVYYQGTQKQWNGINIGSNNEYLINAAIYFKKPVENQYVVNGELITVSYATIEDALAADNGGTIKLLADVTTDVIILKPGVTLDLNGHTLSAEYMVVANGALILDGGENCAGGGLLKIVKANLIYAQAGDKDIIPVWNGADGYIFTKVTFQQMARAAGEGAVQYIFLPALSNSDVVALLADGGLDNGIKIKVSLVWNNGRSQQFYTYEDVLVEQVFASGGSLVFSLTITGIAGIDDMAANAIVIADSGAQAANIGTAIIAN